MELTPDIAGRTNGHAFADPWFDNDHDGDITKGPIGIPVDEPQSAIVTAPPRSPPRSVPPAPDTTFAIAWPPSSVATRPPSPMPEIAQRRGTKDTLLSAPWFQDASDAAEWRSVAEERRAAQTAVVAAPVARRFPLPMVVVAASAAIAIGVAMMCAAVLVLTVTAVLVLA